MTQIVIRVIDIQISDADLDTYISKLPWSNIIVIFANFMTTKILTVALLFIINKFDTKNWVRYLHT